MEKENSFFFLMLIWYGQNSAKLLGNNEIFAIFIRNGMLGWDVLWMF